MDKPVLPQASQAAVLPAASGASGLVPGWNLVSLPKQPTDPSPAAVFPAGARAFAYDACDSTDPWKVYDPADPGASDLAAVTTSQGLWVEASSSASLPSSGSAPASTTLHLCPGWNLIGFPADGPRSVEAALAPISGKYQRVFGFDPADASDPWELFDPAIPGWANDLRILQPGRGYWILATAEADLPILRRQAVDVALSSPVDLGVITSPTDVLGTVVGDDLESWTLSYRAEGEAAWTRLGSGSTPVAGGRLGAFDPTLLLNGAYEIELAATDAAGETTSVEVDVNVEGQQKIGLFTLIFSDLQVALSGLPIEILRTYDSRDKTRGDFGIGWRLEIRQGSYRNNRKPGDGWQLGQRFLPCDTIGETRSHQTTIRLSDREIYRFKLGLQRGVPTLGGCFAEAHFDLVDGPVPGATLDIPGNTQVLWQNGANEVLDPNTLEAYEPRQVRLTTRDGRTFDLDLEAGVTRLQDLNGNALAITPQGITHSSGRSVVFERDAQGRITRITDPKGESLVYTYDTAGDLAQVLDREEQSTRFTYDARHLLLDIEDARGIKPIRNEYDATGRLVRHVDAFGKAVEYTHDLESRREVVTNRLGHSRVLDYDERGNVVREVDALGKAMLRTFDAKDRLLTETDPLGHTTRMVYDASGNLTNRIDPLGDEIVFTYNARGQVLTTRDPRGKVTASTYDAQGNLLLARDAAGGETAYVYDSRGNLTSVTDAEGGVSRTEYDGFGRALRQTDALGHETAFSYDANGNALTEETSRTRPDGTRETLTTRFIYDSLDRLVETVSPDGSVRKTVFDPLGQVLQSIDPLGRTTSYRYDDLGRQVEATLPDGTQETRSYDAEGRLTGAQDRGGRTTAYLYDATGRLLRTTYPDGTFTESAYDDAGRPIAATNARRKTTTYLRDASGRQTTIVDALGGRIDFEYDSTGNQVAVTDPNRATTRFEYDDLNRLIRTIYPDGTDRRVTFDALGRKAAETDQAGKVTRFAYDALGRLTSVTDALGQITGYGYDELGNRTAQTDANGHVTRFEYDSLGRMTRRILPDGSSEEMTWDEAGRVTHHKDFAGRVTAFGYDPAGRLLRKTYPDSTAVTFTYTATGRRQSVTDSRGTTSYAYDIRDHLQELTYPDGRKLVYSYDADGNRTGLTAHVGGQVLPTTFTYDDLDRLDRVVDPRGRQYDHGYDANGNRTSLLGPNGVETTWRYDDLNRLKEITTRRTAVGELFQSYTYTLGPAGNRTRIDEHDGTVRAYAYDDLYRLTGETVSGTAAAYDKTFVYDPVGNRLRQIHTGANGGWTKDSTYDLRDRLLTVGGVEQTWDSNGNLLAKAGEAAYAWDFENRLRTVTLADGTVVTHAYDADGNRVRTEVTPPTGPPQVTNYLVDSSDGLSQAVAETDGEGNLTAFYVRGDDLLAVLRPTGDRFYHADGLGSIRLLTNDQGEITDKYSFTAFGELLSHQGGDPNTYLFAGEPLDPNSGFFYLRARWMEPETGRFVSRDTFEASGYDPAALHRYSYASGRPVDLTDPTGLFSFSEITITQAIQATLVTMNFFSTVANVNQAVSASLKVWRALHQNRIWDAVAYASIAVLHIGLAAMSLIGMSVGMSPPPPGFGGLAMSLAAAGDGQVQLFYQTVNSIRPLAQWVIVQVIPSVLSVWAYFSQKTKATYDSRYQKPHIEDGNKVEGWQHIEARHITGTDTEGGPGDLFPPGTTREQLENLARWLVEKGNRVSDPTRQIQVYGKHTTFNGLSSSFYAVVDSLDFNKVITIFPCITGPCPGTL